MRKIKEVLRLKWACGLPNRAVAASCRISTSSVSDYISRAKVAGLSWPLPDDLDEAALREMASGPEAYRHAPSAAELAGIYRGIAVDIPCPAAAFWGGR